MVSTRAEQHAEIKEEEKEADLAPKAEPASLAELEAADDFINFEDEDEEIPAAEAAVAVPVPYTLKRAGDEIGTDQGQKRRRNKYYVN
jgi:hypothetical protein